MTQLEMEILSLQVGGRFYELVRRTYTWNLIKLTIDWDSVGCQASSSQFLSNRKRLRFSKYAVLR